MLRLDPDSTICIQYGILDALLDFLELKALIAEQPAQDFKLLIVNHIGLVLEL